MLASSALAATLPSSGAMASSALGFLNADHLISSFGTYALIGVAIIVFIETGLLFPLLPGDSLLFTAGALVAQDQLHFPLWALCLLLFLAAFGGDQCAYWIGRTLGPKVFDRPDSRIFKRSHIDETNAYFERYGGRTIIVARFIPFVRTYAPVAAGVGKMPYRHYVSFDLVGALLWGVGVTMLGFALGNVAFIKANIEILLVGVVIVSVAPIGLRLLRGYLAQRRRPAKQAADEQPAELGS